MLKPAGGGAGNYTDVYVDNTPGDFLQSRDAQLEKAVEVLKAELRSGAGGPRGPAGTPGSGVRR